LRAATESILETVASPNYSSSSPSSSLKPFRAHGVRAASLDAVQVLYQDDCYLLELPQPKSIKYDYWHILDSAFSLSLFLVPLSLPFFCLSHFVNRWHERPSRRSPRSSSAFGNSARKQPP
jgi:hypothetical protein